MINVVGSLLILLGSLGLLTGCTDSKDQYQKDDPVRATGSQGGANSEQRKVQSENKFTPEPTDPFAGKDFEDDERPVTEAENLAIIAKNSVAPILYGKGLANITFETTFEEAQKILSRDFTGPIYERGGQNYGGLTFYKEGIIIWWRKEAPRTPRFIRAEAEYDGEIKFLPPLNAVRTGMKLNDYFASDDQTGKALIVKLYNFYEGKEESYNCLEAGRCRIDDSNQQEIYHDLGRATFIYSRNEEKRLNRILFSKFQTAGRLKTDLDMINAQFLLKDGDGNISNETVDLLMSWKDVQKLADPVGDTSQGVLNFSKTFESQIFLGISRSKDERSYREPSADEVITTLAVFGNYVDPIKLGDEYIVVEKQGEKVVLNSSADRPDLEALKSEKNKAYLGTKMDILKAKPELQKDLLRQLAAKVEAKVKAKFAQAGGVVSTRFGGFHNDSLTNSYNFVTSYINPNPLPEGSKIKANGLIYLVSIEEKTAFMSYQVGRFIDPFAQKVEPLQVKDIDLGSGSIGGFKLGEEVEISDIDLGFGRATVTYQDPKLGKMQVRSSFSRFSAFNIGVIENEKTGETNVVPVVMHWVNAGGVRIGVESVPVAENKTYKLKIKALTTSGNNAGVANICGQPAISAKFGELATTVVEKLSTQIRSQAKDCVSWVPVDSNATNLVDVMYFPQQGAQLSFSSRELTGVTVYSQDIRKLGGALQ